MAVNSHVYIAGVGICHLESDKSDKSIQDISISAGTKALLDAGVTYGEVKYGIACFLGDDLKVPKSAFYSYGNTGTPVTEVECYSGLFAATASIKAGRRDCSLLIGFDKDSDKPGKGERIAAVAVVLVSDNFLASHPYLKDTSALISGSQLVSPIYSRAHEASSETLATKTAIQSALEQAVLGPEDIQIVELRHGSNMGAQTALGQLNISEDGHASPVSHPFVGSTGAAGLCELIWQLRGWANDRAVPGAKNVLQYTMGPDGTAYATILSRADKQPAPEWETIKHVRDGRERQGHNPATETKKLSYEDWLAVKARDNYVPEKTGEKLGLPVKGGDRAALARL